MIQADGIPQLDDDVGCQSQNELMILKHSGKIMNGSDPNTLLSVAQANKFSSNNSSSIESHSDNDNGELAEVLVADDEPFNLFAIRQQFKSFGVKVEVAADGMEAYEAICKRIYYKQPMPKVMLIDYCMPRLDGPNTCKSIRNLIDMRNDEIREDADQTPDSQRDELLLQPHIYCCTAYTEQTYEKIAQKAGMDEFVNKPINMPVVEEINARLQKSANIHAVLN